MKQTIEVELPENWEKYVEAKSLDGSKLLGRVVNEYVTTHVSRWEKAKTGGRPRRKNAVEAPASEEA